jgi:hypothetical protein
LPAAAKKSALVRALSSCAENPRRRQTTRFLQGLATDELQYIAEFLGSCILDRGCQCRGSRAQLAEAIKQFERSRHHATVTACPIARGTLQDQEHKMILLLEFLCRSSIPQPSLSVAAGQG